MPITDRAAKGRFSNFAALFYLHYKFFCNMKKFSAILTLCLYAVCSVLAQETKVVCGTTIEDQAMYTARLEANIAKANSGAVKERDAIQYVPIHFHLVADANGEGRHKERFVLDQLCDLNEAYAPMDIRFYLKAHQNYGLFNKSINNNNVYSNQSNNFLMQNRKNLYALNVFVVDNAGSGNGGTVTAAAYYSGSNDWIVAIKSYINANSGTNGTLPHEVGHFFSLRHTFYGYENNPFDGVNDPTWPIAPVTGPAASIGFNAPTERVNGTNCSTAADLICDTPPDYNFGQDDPTADCVYNNYGAKDPLGTAVTDPMENNYMSYYDNCNNYTFTQMQQDVILADRETPDRNYLDNTFSPAATEINTPAADQFLVAPASGSTTPYYNEVLLEWNPVDGATYYLLELDVLVTYGTSNYQSFVLTGTSQLVTGLQQDRQYYWRVRPFNEYVTCATARQRNFRTSTTSAVNDIEALSAWQIAPNPSSGDAPVRMLLNATDNIEAAVSIFDATGKQVRNMNNQVFSAGENTLELPTVGLSNGLYFVTIENAEGRSVRKMTILK
jgi:hypothetical protein